jgi:hypothetical protein
MPHRMPWSFRVNQNSAGRRYKLEIRTKTILHNKYKSGRRIRQQIWWKKDAKYKRHKFTLVTPISVPPRSCQSFLAIDHPTFFVGMYRQAHTYGSPFHALHFPYKVSSPLRLDLPFSQLRELPQSLRQALMLYMVPGLARFYVLKLVCFLKAS